MNDGSWVACLLPTKIPDKIFNFNVKYSVDQMKKNSLFDIDAVINDNYDDFMKSIFKGGVKEAQNILGTQNYQFIKYQLMECAFMTILQSYFSLDGDSLSSLKFTKDQELNMYFTMIKLQTKSAMTDEIKDTYYKVFGFNLPMLEIDGKFMTFHQLGGFMSPAQDVILVNTTGQTTSKQMFHETMHATIRELRRTLDLEMYGDTEADQREEIIMHFMTDKGKEIYDIWSLLCHLDIVKDSNGLTTGVKLTKNSKLDKVSSSKSICYRPTSQLNSLTQKCKSIEKAKSEHRAERFEELKTWMKENFELLSVNTEIRNEMIKVASKIDKSPLKRLLNQLKR